MCHTVLVDSRHTICLIELAASIKEFENPFLSHLQGSGSPATSDACWTNSSCIEAFLLLLLLFLLLFLLLLLLLLLFLNFLFFYPPLIMLEAHFFNSHTFSFNAA